MRNLTNLINFWRRLPPRKYLLFLLLFVLSMFLLTLFGGRGLMQIYHLKEERDKILAVNLRLQEENEKISGQISRLRNNKEEVAKIAREELGLVKKGEVVYQFE